MQWCQSLEADYGMDLWNLAIKKNEFINFLGKWLDVEGIMLSEVTQSQKNSNDIRRSLTRDRYIRVVSAQSC